MLRTRTTPVQFCTAFAAVLSVAAGAQSRQPLRKSANQIDYQHRILQWFGHYLRNEPAPGWITSGVSVLEREQELTRASKKGS